MTRPFFSQTHGRIQMKALLLSAALIIPAALS